MFHRYLLEDQLTGKSSVQGYIRALQRGCRCLERECCHGFMIDVIVVVVVVSCTSGCKEVGLKWRRVFRLICCVTVDRRCLLGQGPLHDMTSVSDLVYQ